MKTSKSYRVFSVINALLIIILCFLTLYPYLNQLAISFNQGMDTSMGGITVYPRQFTLDNYKAIFQDSKIYSASVVSVARTVLSVVLSLLVTFAAAYALTRKDLVGRKTITWLLCLPMYVSAGVIPSYILYRYLKLINNFWIYVLPGIFSFYNMVIIRSFVQEIPESLEESALLDGANEFKILFKIIIPLSKPVLATVALWIAVANWNDWTSTLMYVTDAKLYTLQYLTMKIIKQGEIMRQAAIEQAMGNVETFQQPTEESVKAAVLIFTTMPIILVYPFLQKYFVKGVTLGAVKG